MGNHHSYQQKTVVITGASSGIGLELCQRFAEEKANIVLLARRKDRIDALAKTLEKKHQIKTLSICADVRQESALLEAAAVIRQTFSHIDVVIANAGFGVEGSVKSLSIKDFQNQFDTNVFGVIKTVKVFLNDLIASKGQVVLVGSILSYLSPPYYSAYNMSKFAVKALADSLRLELQQDQVSVTLLCPGLVKSEIQQVDNNGVFHPEREGVMTSLQMNTDKASRKMCRAIMQRKKEAVITTHGKVLVMLARFFPWVIWYSQHRLLSTKWFQNHYHKQAASPTC